MANRRKRMKKSRFFRNTEYENFKKSRKWPTYLEPFAVNTAFLIVLTTVEKLRMGE